MVVKQEIIYNKDHNCFGLSVNAILSRTVPEVIPYVWNQAGIVIYKNNAIVNLSPYFESMEDHLKRVANIMMYKLNFNKFEELHEKSIEILERKRSFIICLDVFELPFNMYYKKKHNLHYVEVVNIIGDNYFICDHFYKYIGKITKEIIYKSTASLIKENLLNQFKIYDFDVSKKDLGASLDIKEILKINTTVNCGHIPKDINILTYEDKTHHLGLNQFAYFKEQIANEVLPYKRNISPTYRNLYGFGSSRLNYSNYLKNFLEEYPILEDIIEEYEIIGQESKIIANHILKLNFVDLNSKIQKKLLDRLDKIHLLEEKLLHRMIVVMKSI